MGEFVWFFGLVLVGNATIFVMMAVDDGWPRNWWEWTKWVGFLVALSTVFVPFGAMSAMIGWALLVLVPFKPLRWLIDYLDRRYAA